MSASTQAPALIQYRPHPSSVRSSGTSAATCGRAEGRPANQTLNQTLPLGGGGLGRFQKRHSVTFNFDHYPLHGGGRWSLPTLKFFLAPSAPINFTFTKQIGVFRTMPLVCPFPGGWKGLKPQTSQSLLKEPVSRLPGDGVNQCFSTGMVTLQRRRNKCLNLLA